MARLRDESVCVVVLNWNGWADTLECIESLTPLLNSSVGTVAVVDNASTDDSVAQITEWMGRHSLSQRVVDEEDLARVRSRDRAQLVLIRSSRNRGFAGGNNLGLRYAVDTGLYKYVWVLNNDTIVDGEAAASLIACATDRPDAGIIGSTVLEYYQRNVVQCAGGAAYNPLTTLNRSLLQGVQVEDALACADVMSFDYISGCAMFIPIDVVRKVGELNEDYFLYYEELDYAYRVRRAGLKLAWCRGAMVYHKAGATVGSKSLSRKRKSPLSEYHSDLSALKFTRRFYPLLFPLMFVSRLLLKSVFIAMRRNWYLYGPLLRAYRDYLTDP